MRYLDVLITTVVAVFASPIETSISSENHRQNGSQLLRRDGDYHHYDSTPACYAMPHPFYPWTGFRFHRDTVLSFPALEETMRMSHCLTGTDLVSETVEIDPGLMVDWRLIFCIPDSYDVKTEGCYKLARTRKYGVQLLPLFVPHTFVGGLFKCGDDSCSNENAEPIAPILADEPYLIWVDPYDFTKLSRHHPFLYTPNRFGIMYPRNGDHSWAKYIDTHEKYNYDDGEVYDYFSKLALADVSLESVLSNKRLMNIASTNVHILSNQLNVSTLSMANERFDEPDLGDLEAEYIEELVASIDSFSSSGFSERPLNHAPAPSSEQISYLEKKLTKRLKVLYALPNKRLVRAIYYKLGAIFS